VVPDVEPVVLAENIHLARHRRRVAKPHRNQHPPLYVELGDLAEVVHAIEKTQLCRMCGGHRAELLLDVEPHGHRVDADELAREAGNEQFAAVLAFE
jgi:hypothetical protein